MPKDASTKSSRSTPGSLQFAKDYEDSGDIRRVRLPEDKLKDQFRLSFPERYLDRLSFDKSETFDKRLMQYRLSYLDSQSTSRISNMRRSSRTTSCSSLGNKSSGTKNTSKSNTPTSKSPRKSSGKSQQKTTSRSSSKVKELDESQKCEKRMSPSSSVEGSKANMVNQISAPQSPQRQEGLTPPASKQPSRQGSPKPHIVKNISTSVSLPSNSSYLAYKKAIMQNATSTTHDAGTIRPSSTRSNYNSLEYKRNLLLDHENDTHEKVLKQTNNHVVMDMIATDLALAYVEDNCRDHKAFRSRHDVWEGQRDYVKPWRCNMKLEDGDANVEECIKKNIIVSEPIKVVSLDSNQAGEQGTTGICGIGTEEQRSSIDLLKKYGKNDTQQLYDYSDDTEHASATGRSKEDGSFIRRYSIQTIQWNRQYNSIAGHKQELDEAMRRESMSGAAQGLKEHTPQQTKQPSPITNPRFLYEKLEQYRVNGNVENLPGKDYDPGNHTTIPGTGMHIASDSHRSPQRQNHFDNKRPSSIQMPSRRLSTNVEPKPYSGSKSTASGNNNEANPYILAPIDGHSNKINRGNSKSVDKRRPQSARLKHASGVEQTIKLPSSSSTKEKRPQSTRKDTTKRAISKQSQLKNKIDHTRNKCNNDTLEVRTNTVSGQSNTTLGASAPEVSIHKGSGPVVTTLGPTGQQKYILETEDAQSISKNTLPSSPAKTPPPQQMSSIAISEKSPEIREYTSHAQIQPRLLAESVDLPFKQQPNSPTVLSPILFPHNLETTPRIRTSTTIKNEPHSRILNDLATDLQEIVANKRRKNKKLPISIIDPKDMFPLSPARIDQSQKDFSMDVFDKLPLHAADLNDSMPTALLSSPSRKMTSSSNRNITKLYLNTAVHSPNVPIIDSSMLQESTKPHAYIAPTQLLAIHDNNADEDALAKSQELSLSQERTDLLSSAIQQTLGSQLGTSLPVNEELQTQLYNALAKRMNK